MYYVWKREFEAYAFLDQLRAEVGASRRSRRLSPRSSARRVQGLDERGVFADRHAETTLGAHAPIKRDSKAKGGRLMANEAKEPRRYKLPSEYSDDERALKGRLGKGQHRLERDEYVRWRDRMLRRAR
jgi:hypothetical protein